MRIIELIENDKTNYKINYTAVDEIYRCINYIWGLLHDKKVSSYADESIDYPVNYLETIRNKMLDVYIAMFDCKKYMSECGKETLTIREAKKNISTDERALIYAINEGVLEPCKESLLNKEN